MGSPEKTRTMGPIMRLPERATAVSDASLARTGSGSLVGGSRFKKTYVAAVALCAVLSLGVQMRLQGAVAVKAELGNSTSEALSNLACTTVDGLKRPHGPKNVYTPFSEPFGELVDDCALVAPDPVLIGEGLGPEIDEHDLVFRFNRVPRHMQVQDLGSRTDVLVLDEKSEGAVKFVRPPRLCLEPSCKENVFCQGRECKSSFKALVLTSAWDPEDALRYFGRVPYFVGQFQKSTQRSLNTLLRKNETTNLVTGHFLVLWTMLSNCRRVTLYGLVTGQMKSSETRLVKQLLGGAALDWGHRSKKTRCLDRALLNTHIAVGELTVASTNASSKLGKVERCRFTDLVASNGPGSNPFATRADDCALVTSSSFLLGQGMGPTIDRHGMIFRANRLTTREFAADFGARTDVIFLNCMNSRNASVSTMGTDNLTSCASGGPGCQFKAALLRPCFDNVARHGTAQGVWGKTPYWVGSQGKNIQDTLCTLSDYRLTNPTTGLLAIWSAATMCRNLTIYGFRGTGNADGHASEAKHDLDTEHQFLGDLATRSMRKLNWTRRTNINECLDEIIKSFRLLDGDKLIDARNHGVLSSFVARLKR